MTTFGKWIWSHHGWKISATVGDRPFHKFFCMGKRSRQTRTTGYEELPLVDGRMSAEVVKP